MPQNWGQFENVAGGGRFPNGWNNQPGWQRPGFSDNNNNWNNYNNNNNQGNNNNGQPRPGVHPDDWNSAGLPPPPPGSPGNWPPPRPPSPPPPPNQPPPGWNNPGPQPGNEVENQRKKNKNNRRKNPSNPLDESNLMMPSPNPSLNPVAFDGPTGTQWGNMGAINDEESRKESRNRQYGYAIMACAVVALAVLMVILASLFSPLCWKILTKILTFIATS